MEPFSLIILKNKASKLASINPNITSSWRSEKTELLKKHAISCKGQKQNKPYTFNRKEIKFTQQDTLESVYNVSPGHKIHWKLGA